MARERQGSLQWDEARQTWKVRLTVTDTEGIKSRPWYFLDTRDETIAKQKLRKLVVHFAQPGAVPASPRKLEPYALAWHDELRQGKVAQAESEIGWIKNHILPFQPAKGEPTLGEMHLGDIRTGHIEDMLRCCADKKNLGHGTLVKIRWTVCAILKRAKKAGLIEVNPADDADVPTTHAIEKVRTIPGRR